MLHANELTIGNWCCRRYTYKDSGREVVTDFQITQICKNGEELYVYGPKGNMGRVYQIEPIPLTPEILEKNGFFKSEKSSRKPYQFRDNSTYISIIKGRINMRYSEKIGKPMNAMQIDCNYVHELQHALRLCRIEKLIEL